MPRRVEGVLWNFMASFIFSTLIMLVSLWKFYSDRFSNKIKCNLFWYSNVCDLDRRKFSIELLLELIGITSHIHGVGRNCRFKDCLDFFYFFFCLLYSPLEKCPFFQSSALLCLYVTSTLPGLWPVQLKPFAPLPVSLMSPVCPSIPVLLGPLMLESHKLRYLFCQVEENYFSLALWRLRDAFLQSCEKSTASVFHCQKCGV